MITEADVLTTYAAIRQEFHGFRLLHKPGSGRCGPTIGTWFFISRAWESYTPHRRYAILRHEAVHMQQQRWLGLGNAWLGVLPFLFAYLLLPLPVGFAWFRYRWEREAFLTEMQVDAQEVGADGLLARREHYVSQFRGKGSYGWCYPWARSIERWVDSAMTLAIYLAQKEA